jgi:ABC-2 type transport system ATP-binding protein
MIQIENVSKSYAKSKVKAVSTMNLQVENGEIFGFIGPNGAGKTTTIKMMTGILRPDEGRILINGHDIVREPIGAKMEIGFVPDSQDVFDKLTGMEYLNFMADVYGVEPADRRERIERYLEMFELTKAAGDNIKSYSHGMRQKLMVIGALLHNPPVWVLDEPMVGLDPKSSHLLKQEMRRHADGGNSVFFSTHVLEVAEKLCDRIGIIDHGELIFVGTLEELRSGNQESLEELFLQLTEGE